VIVITPAVSVPERELEFQTSRSGGPGGQNVNKVSSRVTLRFDLEHSSALTPEQKAQIRARLSSRINKEGILQITSQRTRSQDMNREDAVVRFAELLRAALHREKKRIATAATGSSREERLEKKRRRTSVKEGRSGKGIREWDD
jgi:ribosome-associated protein